MTQTSDIVETKVTNYFESKLETEIQTQVFAVNSSTLQNSMVFGNLNNRSEINITKITKTIPDRLESIYFEDYELLARDIASNVYIEYQNNGFVHENDESTYVHQYVEKFKNTRHNNETVVKTDVFVGNEVIINDSIIDPCGFSEYFSDEELDAIVDENTPAMEKATILQTGMARVPDVVLPGSDVCNKINGERMLPDAATIEQSIDIKIVIGAVTNMYTDILDTNFYTPEKPDVPDDEPKKENNLIKNTVLGFGIGLLFFGVFFIPAALVGLMLIVVYFLL